jgi:hypothetical protein
MRYRIVKHKQTLTGKECYTIQEFRGFLFKRWRDYQVYDIAISYTPKYNKKQAIEKLNSLSGIWSEEVIKTVG